MTAALYPATSYPAMECRLFAFVADLIDPLHAWRSAYSRSRREVNSVTIAYVLTSVASLICSQSSTRGSGFYHRLGVQRDSCSCGRCRRRAVFGRSTLYAHTDRVSHRDSRPTRSNYPQWCDVRFSLALACLCWLVALRDEVNTASLTLVMVRFLPVATSSPMLETK